MIKDIVYSWNEDICCIVLLWQMRWCKKQKDKKKNCSLIKVNYKKVYDSVIWKFLLYMLKIEVGIP